ncbi:MAG: peptidylprolyl isomerase [Pseudomonadota bacterium]
MKQLKTWTLAALLAVAAAGPGHATIVRFDTPVGFFYVDLLEAEAPNTVANFLNYLRDGDYVDSIVHRNVFGFVIQGGAITRTNEAFADVPTDPAIQNEPGVSNVRGTMAMAKLADDENSATSQWFINTANSTFLDTDNGGFTVFGRVLGNGMEVVDLINSLDSFNIDGGILSSLPLRINGEFTNEVTDANVIYTQITEVAGFTINAGLSGAWFNAATPGQGFLLDIIDSGDRQEVFVAWFTYDVNTPGDDEGAGFGSTQHRWFTAGGTFSGDTATLTISRNTGGIFNDPATTDNEPVGTMTIRFIDCTTAVLAFDFDDDSITDATIDIIRLSPDAFCGDLAVPTD